MNFIPYTEFKEDDDTLPKIKRKKFASTVIWSEDEDDGHRIIAGYYYVSLRRDHTFSE